MNISELKHGDAFYDASCFDVKKYIYIGIHPTYSNYHILVFDGTKIAHCVYEPILQHILDKGLAQYSDARKLMIQLLQDQLEAEKSKMKSESGS